MRTSQVESQVYSCLESMFDEDEERGLGASELAVSKTQPPDDDDSDEAGEGQKGEREGKEKQEEIGESDGEGAAEGDVANSSVGSEGGAVGPNAPKGVSVGVRRFHACRFC